MMRIPKPDEAHDDLVRTMFDVSSRRSPLVTDVELELAGDMNQPVAVSAPSKDQHHCDS